MTTYVVLLTGDETAWERMTAEQQASVFAKHEEFASLLAARGHQLTRGEELMPSQTTKKVTKGADGQVAVTDGPYAETVEQLGALYLVESDDLEDLLEICGDSRSPMVRSRFAQRSTTATTAGADAAQARAVVA